MSVYQSYIRAVFTFKFGVDLCCVILLNYIIPFYSWTNNLDIIFFHSSDPLSDYLIYTFKEFTIMKHTKISNSELSSISTNHQYISDKNGNLSIRIELKYPEHLNLYLVVLENHVKSYGKKCRITEFHIVYDSFSCDIWKFKTDVPYSLIESRAI